MYANYVMFVLLLILITCESMGSDNVTLYL